MTKPYEAPTLEMVRFENVMKDPVQDSTGNEYWDGDGAGDFEEHFIN